MAIAVIYNGKIINISEPLEHIFYVIIWVLFISFAMQNPLIFFNTFGFVLNFEAIEGTF